MVNSVFVLYLFSYRVDVVKVPIVNNVQQWNNQQQTNPNGNKIITYAPMNRLPEMKLPCQMHMPVPQPYPNMVSAPVIMVPVKHARQPFQIPGFYPNTANTPNMVTKPSCQCQCQSTPHYMTRTPEAMMPSQTSQLQFPSPVISPLKMLSILNSMPVPNQHNQKCSNSQIMYPSWLNTQKAMMPVMNQPSRLQPPFPPIYPSTANTPNMMMPISGSQSQFPTPVISTLTNLPILHINQPNPFHATSPMHHKTANTPEIMMPLRNPFSHPEFNRPNTENIPKIMPLNQLNQPHFPTPVASPLRLLPILHNMPVNHHIVHHQAPIKSMEPFPVQIQSNQPHFGCNHIPTGTQNTQFFPFNNQPSQPILPWPVMKIMPLPEGPGINHQNQFQSTLPKLNQNKANFLELLMPLIKQVIRSESTLPKTNVNELPNPSNTVPLINQLDEIKATEVTTPETNQLSQDESVLPVMQPDMQNERDTVIPKMDMLPSPPEVSLPSVSMLPTVAIPSFPADSKADFKDYSLTDNPVFIQEISNSIY